MGTFSTLEPPKLDVGAAHVPAPQAPRPKRRRWPWLLLLAAAAYGGWHYRGAFNSQPAPTAGGGGRSSADRPVPVVVATSTRGDLLVYLRGLGSVTPLNTVTVHTRVDGQLINVAFKEGQNVHQGDLLAEIDPRPFQVQLEQTQGQLARDVAQRNDAQAIYQRDLALFKEQIVPQQQLDTQKATVDQYDGNIQSDQAQIDNAKLQLSYCRITAPLTGRVGLRLVDPGNLVHAADPNGLVVISQLQPIAVLFTLPQDQLAPVYSRLRAGDRLPAEAYDASNTNKVASGELLTIDNQIDPATGTYKLKAVFSNEDGVLFPNQFVNVRLLVDTKHDLTLVPNAAILHGPQGDYVYRVTDGAARVTPVTVALTDGDNTGLTAGLDPGNTVVIDGQDKLQDGTKVEPRMGRAAAISAGGKSEPGAGGPITAALGSMGQRSRAAGTPNGPNMETRRGPGRGDPKQ
jgi:membrane fusion protein, multidrug efflux system